MQTYDERLARYELWRGWRDDEHLTYQQIADRAAAAGGVRLTEQRVKQVLDRPPRPVGRPPTRRAEEVQHRLDVWLSRHESRMRRFGRADPRTAEAARQVARLTDQLG